MLKGLFSNKENVKNRLKNQADKKNSKDLKNILNELEDSAKNGEYIRVIQLKSNQATYLASLGLKVENDNKFGYYRISWC